MLVCVLAFAVLLWMTGILSHPGGDGSWVYHYQSLVSGGMALVGGFFVILTTHMAFAAEEKARRIKADIYWNRYKIELETFMDFINNELSYESMYIPDAAGVLSDGVIAACQSFFNSFANHFPRAMFDISNIQYLSPDKRTLLNAVYTQFWKIETSANKKFWDDEAGQKQAYLKAVNETVKLIKLLERHIKPEEDILNAALKFQKAVQDNI